jgi:hypothetical protein
VSAIIIRRNDDRLIHACARQASINGNSGDLRNWPWLNSTALPVADSEKGYSTALLFRALYFDADAESTVHRQRIVTVKSLFCLPVFDCVWSPTPLPALA